MKQKEMNINDKVFISGPVKYGDEEYRVSCNGTIIEIGRIQSLVNVENIDGDGNVSTFVKNKFLFKI